jgi:hypothetical protein
MTPEDAPASDSRVHSCPLCGALIVRTMTHGRFVVVSCQVCRGTVRIEFSPPDAPGVIARIENITDEDES